MLITTIDFKKEYLWHSFFWGIMKKYLIDYLGFFHLVLGFKNENHDFKRSVRKLIVGLSFLIFRTKFAFLLDRSLYIYIPIVLIEKVYIMGSINDNCKY